MMMMDGAAQNSVSPGAHFPNQPSRSPGSSESNYLTFWWGVTLCPPEMNDISLAENVVIVWRAGFVLPVSPRVEGSRGITLSASQQFDTFTK